MVTGLLSVGLCEEGGIEAVQEFLAKSGQSAQAPFDPKLTQADLHPVHSAGGSVEGLRSSECFGPCTLAIKSSGMRRG